MDTSDLGEQHTGESPADILVGDVMKTSALNLNMSNEQGNSLVACENKDNIQMEQQPATCVLVLPVNQPGDVTTGNMAESVNIKAEAVQESSSSSHVIGTLQDGTPVSISGTLPDNMVEMSAGTSSLPTIHSVDSAGNVQLTGGTIEQQLAAAKAVAEMQASLANADHPDGSQPDLSFMVEDSNSKGGTFDPVTQSWFTSKHTKDNLSEQGHKWKQGMWSKEEVDILESNIEEYLKVHNIADANLVIFEMNKEERKDFYRFIAKGLERPLFAVYRRVIRMYDQKNHVGKYSKEDIAKLKCLREKHGNDWALIGMEMGRSASSVKDKFRLLKESCHQGKWSPEEENLLANSVYELSNAEPGESITTGISWAQVAERVATRTEKQCRAKWLNYLNWKEQGGAEWSKEDDSKLIERITVSGIEEERLLNWEELSKDWSSVRSPQWLRSKWWNLKRNVIGNESLGLGATIECLKTFPKRPFAKAMRQHQQHQQQRIKLARVELPALSDMRGATATLTVRVPIQLSQGGSTATVTLDSNDVDQATSSSISSIQELEILQTSVSGMTTNTYLITTPFHHKNMTTTQATPSTLMANRQGTTVGNSEEQHIFTRADPLQGGQSTDHLILRRADSLHSNENVTVQLNHNQHGDIILTSKPQSSTGNASSPLNVNITSAMADTPLAVPSSQHDDISNDTSHLATEINQSDSSEDPALNSQSQVIGTDAVLAQQDVGSSDLTEVGSEPETTLVIVSTAPSSDLGQSSGSVEDTQLGGGVFTLTGPMLHSQSDGNDLMASPVDSDPCKDKLVDSPPDHHCHDSVDS